MITFLKANVASLSASFFDYLITIVLVSFCKVNVVAASATGVVCGGILNFTIGRNWVFESSDATVQNQAAKYGVVWLGNLFLNTAGLYVFTRFFKVQYFISKVFISLLVGYGYNYSLQKRYVFKHN